MPEYEIQVPSYRAAALTAEERTRLLARPIQNTQKIRTIVQPIIEDVKSRGEASLIDYASKFEKVQLKSAVLKAPFDDDLMKISPMIKEDIDIAFNNIFAFHSSQLRPTIAVQTMRGVVCQRMSRPINRVGLYIPGGTAVLPSTALMLGVPAKVAGCPHVVISTPVRKDGTVAPEIVYIANKIGAEAIILAGGAQAIAAMAYGISGVPKVNKIFGPGNQFVTAAKMHVQNDYGALVAIDLPAGPSEVLVIADETCNPESVALDLLSQAEHGLDSQIILLTVSLSPEMFDRIQKAINDHALRLSRSYIIKHAIKKSVIVQVDNVDQAFEWSNLYGPEHLVLHLKNASSYIPKIDNAGSVFVGPWSPVSMGDYASGTNHTLPTYGYASSYSGVSTDSFLKYITTQELTEEGIQRLGPTVIRLAELEGLTAHADAVRVRGVRL
ncbi:histidinol dehydrogenase His2 [Schizosaccharomyces pombe]|uniref:Histidinol dehydrogenase n=1 Tax=Schizosaccharomyces pombe (strain 972 / ATCC 24843) TaxID=284812 RepID=HISX_SCHPO|nr:putative histidinol dehydrogenase His2 [Schizosaccharomyces pombe]Q9P777.1 RecName: Full=Histidinol dehydrogenase; Short=HDH [Schizosaccharomyces pombe 972h-]CAB88243.1 histidinol dehydrogenase His2 (predicted) [Schizosaccharomyces pombe]|eukprot:NP_595886.1 putative histidinol dehydrogenase His2 [Schizosaccharomyces pombe]